MSSSKDLRQAVAAHGAELYRLAYRQLSDVGVAEEVVQETFLRAWRARDRFDPNLASLRTWLFSIARNVIIDTLRRRSVRDQIVDLTDRAESIEDHADSVLRSFQVEEALARLSPAHREALVEVYYRDRPAKAVADELSLPVGTVRSRVFYGLRALRLALEEMGWRE
ncbi:sigma-70 family RNA polymerase sigma factor [Euzebya tangerina]|uniref:sigma-70 family RNA polymerase sigma factor n=1 Tax=Euzebya tangerina TaxID=591198 RepID=UPI000E31BC1C|nr:sigma-70 family RNA polymerase sigma factor [Euzebya tangerina]